MTSTVVEVTVYKTDHPILCILFRQYCLGHAFCKPLCRIAVPSESDMTSYICAFVAARTKM